MNELPQEVSDLLLRIRNVDCSSVSISRYGALQLGFGNAVDYVIAGKYSKKRFQIEVGTYGASWRYVDVQGRTRSYDSREEQALSAELLHASLVSIEANGSCVVLKTDAGGNIVIDVKGMKEDVLYAHIRDATSIFFNPVLGWTIE